MSDMIDSRDISLVGRYHRPYHFNWFSVFAPVVPYVYDGSLSLLEMVHKLLYYINKVNQATNDNHTDIINLANEVQALADEVAELPELIARIEALIAMLPPLYMVNITTDGNVATMDKTIDEIRENVAEGKIPMALVNENILAIYEAHREIFQYNSGSGYTVISEFTDNVGSVENTALIDETGGVITGLLTILNTPVNSTDAVNKAYVDNAIEENKAKIVPFTVATMPAESTPVDMAIDMSEVFSEDDVYNVLLNYGTMYFRCVHWAKNSNSANFVYFLPTRSLEGMVCYYAILDGRNNTAKIYGYTAIKSSVLREIYVQKNGDTMRGTLVLNGNPVNNLDAVPKQYVDREVADINTSIAELENAMEIAQPYNVTITRNNDVYEADHYATDINTTFGEGKDIKALFGNAVYTLIQSSASSALFVKVTGNTINTFTITNDSVVENNYFVVTPNGTSLNNTVITTLLLDYEITEDKQAVNKEYVDTAIGSITPEAQIVYVNYNTRATPMTADATYDEVIDYILNGKVVIASFYYNGVHYWGFPFIDSEAGVRYCTHNEVGRNVVTLKHNTDNSISTQLYAYVTAAGGEITSGSLNITRRAKAYYTQTPTTNTEIANKKYVDDALAESVPTVLDAQASGSAYTLPYQYATLGVLLVRNPYMAVRWQQSSGEYEVMYFGGIRAEGVIFYNDKYKGVYDNSDVLTFTQI